MNRRDIFLIIGILLVAGILYLVMNQSEKGGQVVITIDGKEYGVYSLTEDEEITIRNEYGYNRIVIEDGMVSIRDADCPDKYCVGQGKSNDVKKSLICLPHKLIVEIRGTQQDGIDMITK